MSKKRINLHAVLIPLIALLIIGGCAAGIYVFTELKKKDVRIAELITQAKDLETQKTDLQTSLSDEMRKARGLEQDKQGAVNIGASLLLQTEVLKKIGRDIATEFDNLDALILSDDARNIAVIDWFVENGTFYTSDGSLTAATLRYEDWKRRQIDSTKEYKRIKASVDTSVEKFGNQMEALNNLDLSTGTEMNSQVN